jgi:hypothetical protein
MIVAAEPEISTSLPPSPLIGPLSKMLLSPTRKSSPSPPRKRSLPRSSDEPVAPRLSPPGPVAARAEVDQVIAAAAGHDAAGSAVVRKDAVLRAVLSSVSTSRPSLTASTRDSLTGPLSQQALRRRSFAGALAVHRVSPRSQSRLSGGLEMLHITGGSAR